MEIFAEDPWIFWLILAGVFAVAEIATAGLLLIMLAGGAAAAAGASALGLGTVASASVFAVVSVALIAFARPVASRHMYQAPLERSGTAALVGAPALVMETVDSRDGRVKIGGEIWSARTLDESATYEPGDSVSVMLIDGATAIVG